MTRHIVACATLALAVSVIVVAEDLPAGYPPLLKELQSVPRLVQRQARQVRESNASGEAAARARTSCDAAMPTWNAWVDALTGSLAKKSDPLPADFAARSESAGKAAASCAVQRLVVNLPALSEQQQAAQEKRLVTNLQQVGQQIWRRQTGSNNAKRQATAQCLNETLRWTSWDEAR